MEDAKEKNLDLDKYSSLVLLHVDHFWLLWPLESFLFAAIDKSWFHGKDLVERTT